MPKYNGCKCISCGELFKSDDDVVVCPDCGTPYHRECYLREGQCINIELHEKKQSWEPENWKPVSENADDNEDSITNEPIRCIRCGADNAPGTLFCSKCGMPLSKKPTEERLFSMPPKTDNGNNNNAGGFAGNPFAATQMTFDKDSDMDGIKLGDYAKYIGKNPLIMLSNFLKFAKTKSKVSLNFVALLFPELYYFYRKMNIVGILAMVLAVVLRIPNLIVAGQEGFMGTALLQTNIDVNSNLFVFIYNLCGVISSVGCVLSGLFANYLYYKKAKKDITKIRSETGIVVDEETVGVNITKKGGTSFAGLFLATLIYMTVVLAIIFLFNGFLK